MKRSNGEPQRRRRDPSLYEFPRAHPPAPIRAPVYRSSLGCPRRLAAVLPVRLTLRDEPSETELTEPSAGRFRAASGRAALPLWRMPFPGAVSQSPLQISRARRTHRPGRSEYKANFDGAASRTAVAARAAIGDHVRLELLARRQIWVIDG